MKDNPNRHTLHSGLTDAEWNTCGLVLLIPFIVVVGYLFWRYILT